MAKRTDPVIMFVKPSAVSEGDKTLLRSVGVIVIEIDDPQSAKLIRAGMELEAGTLLNAAAAVVRASPLSVAAFGKAVAEAIDLQYAKEPTR